MGVIGDFGSAAVFGPSFEGAVANLVKSWNPDFIMTVGDNNYPSGEAETIDENIGQFYHEYIYRYRGSYGAGATRYRFFPTLGNHDYFTPGAQPYLDYFTLPGNERYYNYRHGLDGLVEIFALDSNVDANGTNSVQALWLQTRLAASTATWKLVYFHHPPYSSGLYAPGHASLQWPFAAWGVSAVITGHDHIYERIHTNDLVYFINGLGGAFAYPITTIVPGSQVRFNEDLGAMRIEATETNLLFHFVTRNNVIVDYVVLGEPSETLLIVGHPQSQTVLLGQTAIFSAAATPVGVQYQWQFNSIDIPGATNDLLVITNVQFTHEGDYSVIVSGHGSSVQSTSARLTVPRQPLITAHPQSQKAIAGSNVTFIVAAVGVGTLRFQWLSNGVESMSATEATLTLTNVQLQDAAEYSARVTDDLGSVISNPARLTVFARPTVTQQAISQTAVVGQRVVFSLTATGTFPMTNSWRLGAQILTNIVVSQSPSFFVIPSVQPSHAGTYRVGILNEVGASGTLRTAGTLTVLEDKDGDGVADPWEEANSLSPNNPNDAGLDPDGDRLSNRAEYLAGTNPNAAESRIEITEITVASAGVVKLSFLAASNSNVLSS